MTDGNHTHLAQKALQSFDVHGQDRMLSFLADNQAAIETSEHHHPGLIVLTDHSVVQPTARGYRFYWTDHDGKKPEPRMAERETTVDWKAVPAPPMAGPGHRPASDETIAKVIKLVQNEASKGLEDEGIVTAAQPPAMTPREASDLCPGMAEMAATALTKDENSREAQEAAQRASSAAADDIFNELPEGQRELLGETIRQRLSAAIPD